VSKPITLSFANKTNLKDIIRTALEQEAGDLFGENDAMHITNAVVKALYEKSEPTLDELTVAELKQLAEARHLTVVGTGYGGRILKADYIRVLV
jgi:hypothetical protein